jgi:hypothetical protein
LSRRSNDHDRLHDRAEQAHDALEHELGAEGERGLGQAHAGAFAAGEDKAADAGNCRFQISDCRLRNVIFGMMCSPNLKSEI